MKSSIGASASGPVRCSSGPATSLREQSFFDSGAALSQGSFQRAVWITCRCLYRIKNILILCSSRIFGLRSGIPENIGIRGADHPPAPAVAAKEVLAALADPGDAMLPGQHAGPLQRLQRLGNRATGAACPQRDCFIARKADTGAAVVKAPQERL